MFFIGAAAFIRLLSQPFSAAAQVHPNTVFSTSILRTLIVQSTHERACNVDGGVSTRRDADEHAKRKAAVDFAAEDEQNHEHDEHHPAVITVRLSVSLMLRLHQRDKVFALVNQPVLPDAVEE